MKYKLLASDMDGTLLNSKSELSERTKTAVISAVNSGVIFVTATGRPFCNIKIVNDVLDKDLPFIVLNGSAAYMGKSKELLLEKYLDFDLAIEAFEIGQTLGLPQIIWAGGRLWTNRECKETLAYRDFSTVGSMGVTSNLKDIRDKISGVSKILWIGDRSYIAEKYVEMTAHFDKRLNCFTSGASIADFLEFVSIDSGKGAALEYIANRYGIDKNEVIAIGDARNDISMLKYAGFSVAMGNASDEIKEICDFVTSSNDDDGVAAVIEEFILSSLSQCF